MYVKLKLPYMDMHRSNQYHIWSWADHKTFLYDIVHRAVRKPIQPIILASIKHTESFSKLHKLTLQICTQLVCVNFEVTSLVTNSYLAVYFICIISFYV